MPYHSRLNMNEDFDNALAAWLAKLRLLPDLVPTGTPAFTPAISPLPSSALVEPLEHEVRTLNLLERHAPTDLEAAALRKRLRIVASLPDDVVYLILQRLVDLIEHTADLRAHNTPAVTVELVEPRPAALSAVEHQRVRIHEIHPRGMQSQAQESGRRTEKYTRFPSRSRYEQLRLQQGQRILQQEPAKVLFRVSLTCKQWRRCAADSFQKPLPFLSIDPLAHPLHLSNFYPYLIHTVELQHPPPNELILRRVSKSYVQHLYIRGGSLADPWTTILPLGETSLRGLRRLSFTLASQANGILWPKSIASLPSLDNLTVLTLRWSVPEQGSVKLRLPTCPNLTTLNLFNESVLSWSSPDDNVDLTEEDLLRDAQLRFFLSDMGDTATKLERLSLGNWGGSDPETQPFFQKLTNLEGLTLYWNPKSFSDWLRILMWTHSLLINLPVPIVRLNIFTPPNLLYPRPWSVKQNYPPWLPFICGALAKFKSLAKLKTLAFGHSHDGWHSATGKVNLWNGQCWKDLATLCTARGIVVEQDGKRWHKLAF